MVKISLLIPTHFRSADVRRLLESISMQDYDLSEVEVILVSNLSDPDLEVLQDQRWNFSLHIFTTHTLGVNIARNLALKKAQGEIVYFLDDDCILPSKNHLQQLMKTHAKHGTATGVGGYYFLPENSSPCDRAYNLIQMTWQETTGSFIGGNSSYKKSMIPKGLLFDERIVFGGAENSFNEFMRNRGQQLHLSPEVSVIHATHLSAFELIRKAKAQSRLHNHLEFRQGLNRYEQIWNSSPLSGYDIRTLFYVELYKKSFNDRAWPSLIIYLNLALKFWFYISRCFISDHYYDQLVNLDQRYFKK